MESFFTRQKQMGEMQSTCVWHSLYQKLNLSHLYSQNDVCSSFKKTSCMRLFSIHVFIRFWACFICQVIIWCIPHVDSLFHHSFARSEGIADWLCCFHVILA